MRRNLVLPAALAGAVILAGGTAILLSTTADTALACTESALVAAINAADSAGGGDIPSPPAAPTP
ncbi:MAG: hypothetical protein ABIS86_06210 [Streptosporangiaceae bacterium]